MGATEVAAALPPLNWLDVGEPPREVVDRRRRRARTVRTYGSVLGGLVIGGMAGWAATTLWPGSDSWTVSASLLLFLAVAVPVGIGSFAFDWWFFPKLDKATSLQVRRVGVSMTKLYVERTSGEVSDWPLKRVLLSRQEVTPGWYAVGLPVGQAVLTFHVPALVASSIRSAMPG